MFVICVPLRDRLRIQTTFSIIYSTQLSLAAFSLSLFEKGVLYNNDIWKLFLLAINRKYLGKKFKTYSIVLDTHVHERP